jgi:cytochrome c biogenesis factor
MIKMNNISVRVAWLFAAVFMWIAFIEFSSNFFNVEKEFFETNLILKLVHIITAVFFIILTRLDEEIRIQSIQVFGITYMMISGIGFMGMNIRIGVQWESAIYLNLLTYIQFGLGIALSAIGMILKKRKDLISDLQVA